MRILSILLLVFMFVSCNTTPKQPPPPPKLTVNLSSPQVPLGAVDMQIDRTFPLSGLRRVNIDVIYFPNEEAVCLKYRSDFFTYHQFWDQDSRQVFLAALETYGEDYTNRNLDSNSRTSRTIYGNVESFLIWQEFQFTKQYRGNMSIDIGYFFRERSPYFCVTQKQATFTDPIHNTQHNSQNVPMYFTRAQAGELAVFFDEELLESHASARTIPRRNASADVDFDVY